jgi:flavin-dependent dehydrogenase
MASNPQKVAIVGAGVIGLYLAWQLSLKGHKVSVYEKKPEKDFGDKPCSTLVSERIRNFIPIEDDLIENKISGCLINFPKKTVRLDFQPIHLVLSRPAVLARLLELAQKEGAEVSFEKDIKKIPEGFDKIIGCDGALSKVRESLSLSGPRFRLGVQFFQKEKDGSGLVETWPTKNGFCWRIPRGEETEWGILEKPEASLGRFKEFLKDRNVSFEGGQGSFPAALVPSGLVLPKDKNITLCGDAAGLAKPWSGGGLIWGLKAASILLETFPDFEAYRKKTRRFFVFRIAKGRTADFLVHFLGKRLPFLLPGRILYDNDFPVL